MSRNSMEWSCIVSASQHRFYLPIDLTTSFSSPFIAREVFNASGICLIHLILVRKSVRIIRSLIVPQ